MPALSTPLLILLILCILSALAFEFINGFHDTANAVATVIYTHALKPGTAVIWSGIWNFIGVNVGGIAVAIGIINLLPVEALTDPNLYNNLAMVMALIITAILWNIGTWYLGIPCSSSHTLIGSITGVSIAYILLPGNHEITLNWGKVKDAGLSLVISPVIGFFLAWLLMYFLKSTVKNKAIFKEAPAKKAPPLWIRSILILTSTFVSFSHGSNDGQKGVGLLMIILIAIVPMRFSLDHSRDPRGLQKNATEISVLLTRVDTTRLAPAEKDAFLQMKACADSLSRRFAGVTSMTLLPEKAGQNSRRDILVLAKKASWFTDRLSQTDRSPVPAGWPTQFTHTVKKLRTYTEYAPWWVIFAISVTLGLGTMVGWKRIVITIGEKIGKSHLNYAQGATANLIAATTISVSSVLGLPVSTTHVLSSGVAGTMVSGSGMANLQTKTLTAIGIAWLITIPVTVLLSGILFLVFRLFII
jgi:phosphate/sulfate permease